MRLPLLLLALVLGCGQSLPTPTPASVLPRPLPPPVAPAPNVTVNSDLQDAVNWQGVHDTGTSGASTGTMELISTPAFTAPTREFDTTFTGNGGERYWYSYAKDTTATNFRYDTDIWLAAGASSIANIEMDLNQVLADGHTVIYGFQCDGWSGTWDYTGLRADGSGWRWFHTTAPCNPRKWTPNAWHHVTIIYFRDSVGTVTYQQVSLDGQTSVLNAVAPSARINGWSPGTLLTNFQIDGLGDGTAVVYMGSLTISRW